MNRSEWQQLSTDRVRDAKALLAAGRWSGAYYLAGYAVECALKSCVLAHVERTGVIFEDRKYAEQCWTHKLEDLMRLADLKDALEDDIAKDSDFGLAWNNVKDWKESSRYARWSKAEAVRLYKAITDTKHGVLPWIKLRW
jgi:hypothetical protein